MPLPHKNQPKKKKKKASSVAYMKYAGMASSMFIILFLSYWVGQKIDEKMGNETPYMALTIMMLALFVYFYKMIKALS